MLEVIGTTGRGANPEPDGTSGNQPDGRAGPGPIELPELAVGWVPEFDVEGDPGAGTRPEPDGRAGLGAMGASELGTGEIL